MKNKGMTFEPGDSDLQKCVLIIATNKHLMMATEEFNRIITPLGDRMHPDTPRRITLSLLLLAHPLASPPPSVSVPPLA